MAAIRGRCSECEKPAEMILDRPKGKPTGRWVHIRVACRNVATATFIANDDNRKRPDA